jgi:hypothetical protein
MELPDGRIVVSEGGMDTLKRTQRLLATRDIGSEIVSPPKKFCSS